MPRIDVHRYKGETGFKGYITPETEKWIVFVRNDGKVMAYNRDPKTGEVIGEPAVLN